MKLHAGHIELAVVALLNHRVYTVVPNVSWGLGINHECDLLAMDKNGRFTEIEIKISMSDLRADFKKRHQHGNKFISRLAYAFPETMLEKAEPLIPAGCGIITVWPMVISGEIRGYNARWHRGCKHDLGKPKPDEAFIRNFMRLGCMRIWSLKRHNYDKQWQNKK